MGKIVVTLGLALLLNAGAVAATPHKSQPCVAWQDSFNTGQLDTSRWVVANGRAPGYIPAQHIGYYEPGNVRLDGGMLTLTLTQVTGQVDTNASGVISYGALLYTKAACGYGTYEWTMKMSSSAICPACQGTAVSGSVSAGFVYVNNSQTEIDVEFSGATPSTLWLVNWLNPTPQNDPTSADETYTPLSPFNSTNGFHKYKVVWSPGSIAYYIDGILFAHHTTNVPSAPANFMINHWGTNNPNWGGNATLGVVRYFYITGASYTPPNGRTAPRTF